MKYISRFLTGLCATYTVTSVLFLLLQLMISGGADKTNIRTEAFLMILPFAALVSLAQVMYSLPRPVRWIRLLIHFALCMTGAYLCLYLPFNSGAGGANALLVVTLFILVYWCIMGVYLALCGKRDRADRPTYQNIYKK